MFQVKIDTVRERTTNGPTYMKGRTYYRQGQVKHLSFDRAKGFITAQVEGSRTYTVLVVLDSSGQLHDASCNCSAFASYWGFCHHIAAVLLSSIDTFGKEKTNIAPAAKKAPAKEQGPDRQTATEQASRQALRRQRNKTRDFLAKLENVIELSETGQKQQIRLQVILQGVRNASTLPWLTFAIGQDHYHTISNVEQFIEAYSRDLPLELAGDFTFDPLLHCFAPENLPLLHLLQDAFENDYKAVFGTVQSSSQAGHFTLNASRFASFLLFSGQLEDCSWQPAGSDKLQPVAVRQERLPLSLLLSVRPDAAQDQESYQLELVCPHTVVQLTASRNVYLVDDTFFLPSQDSIRLLEPVLSSFGTTAGHPLPLNNTEASWLISKTGKWQSACPLLLQSGLEERLVAEPLLPEITLDTAGSGLKVSLSWHYGPYKLDPLENEPEKSQPEPDNILLKRDFPAEDKITACLQDAGFVHQAGSLRLKEAESIYSFLAHKLADMQKIGQVNLTEAAARLAIWPAPAISYKLHLSDQEDKLVLEQNYADLAEDEIEAYFQALRDDKAFLRRPDGSFRQVCAKKKEAFLTMFDLVRQWQTGFVPSSSLPRYRALDLEPLLDGLENPAVLISKEIKQMLEHLKKPETLKFRIPAKLNSRLRPYQKKGVQWLSMLNFYGLGGILADDMGLGKTFQTIAFVHMLWSKRKKASLIIAPTSLIYNWLSEFNKFSPQLPVLLIDGNRSKRSSLFAEIEKHACVITSYALLRRDISEIKDYSFASCFIDEAQNIKNPATLNARSVKQIKADRTFALTGTPLENSLIELWSIFDFVLPGYLQDRQSFQNRFELPLKDNEPGCLDQLQQLIRPFILRRLKKDVLQELPDKIESATVCDMTTGQRELYNDFLAQSRADLKQEIASGGYAGNQIYILALLTRLRQICCHPALFRKNYTGGSGKLDLLEELLADCFSSGHRVLVFSQFTSMLDLIRENQLQHGVEPFYIDGQVPSEERLKLVERFNSGEGQLFLISLKAGGTGLNLTGADTVIHYDPWWNPAVEEQATDRAYRIGQENVVQVFKLYTRNSVEEKILALQAKKQNLVDSIIKPGQNLLSKMTLEEVMGLFDLSAAK